MLISSKIERSLQVSYGLVEVEEVQDNNDIENLIPTIEILI